MRSEPQPHGQFPCRPPRPLGSHTPAQFPKALSTVPTPRPLQPLLLLLGRSPLPALSLSTEAGEVPAWAPAWLSGTHARACPSLPTSKIQSGPKGTFPLPRSQACSVSRPHPGPGLWLPLKEQRNEDDTPPGSEAATGGTGPHNRTCLDSWKAPGLPAPRDPRTRDSQNGPTCGPLCLPPPTVHQPCSSHSVPTSLIQLRSPPHPWDLHCLAAAPRLELKAPPPASSDLQDPV